MTEIEQNNANLAGKEVLYFHSAQARRDGKGVSGTILRVHPPGGSVDLELAIIDNNPADNVRGVPLIPEYAESYNGSHCFLVAAAETEAPVVTESAATEPAPPPATPAEAPADGSSDLGAPL